MLAVMRASPAVLNAFSRELDRPKWTENPQPGEWSFTEILCHFRDVDNEINLPRIHKVLNEANPFLPGIDSDKWAEERLYYCQNGNEALRDFTASRIQLLDILDDLKPEALTGDLSGFYKLRAGDHRILYEVLRDEKTIVIHVIGHRREVYRRR